MQIVMTQTAEKGSRFAQDALVNQIGKEMPFKIDGELYGTCTLLGACVAEDGSFVTMTYEVPEIFEPQPLSVAFAEES